MIEHIVETHAGSVVTIRINRPDKRNALTSEMYEALITALETANADDQIGVIVIVGSGGSFSAGNDLASFLGAANRTVFRWPCREIYENAR